MKSIIKLCLVAMVIALTACQEKTAKSIEIAPDVNAKALKFAQMMVFDDLKSSALGGKLGQSRI
jgi:hypothetical protein